MILDAILDALLDTAKTVPFLLAAFLLLETLEHYSNNFMNRALGKMGKAGPLVGAIFGCVPQCGFSVAAANLYSGGVITLGTLMAVFLSTSDEAILILFSHPGSGRVIGQLLLGKMLIGIVAGYLLDFLLRKKKEHKNIVLGWGGMGALTTFLGKDTWFQPFLTALLGLIPNCASSILITELYLAGGLSLASAMGGLCAGAGVGLAVLFRENHPAKENAAIVGLLYLLSAGAGLLLEFIL